MDDKNSSQAGGKNQSFAQKNKNGIIVAGIVIVLLVIYFSTRTSTETGMEAEGNSTKTEQSSDSDNKGETSSDKKAADDKQQMDKKMEAGDKKSGEMMKGDAKTAMSAGQNGEMRIAGGMLAKSDNEAKGNYMVTTLDHGTFYVHTSRDFSSLVGKTVTLTAKGTTTAFTLLDIKAEDGTSPAAMQDNTAKGGESETPPAGMTAPETKTGEFTFSGSLSKSESDKGNYAITSGKTTVYLKTSKDYSAWVGSEVTLKASGDVKSFTGAQLAKK